jgi:hypothetical protein
MLVFLDTSYENKKRISFALKRVFFIPLKNRLY